MAKNIKWDDEIGPKLVKAEPRLVAFLYASCAYHARRGQTFARKNAKWTDRTSNARNGLFGKPFKDGRKKFGLVIFGTVTYQPWLEIRFSGRYAIIGPTIRHEAPELMQTVSTAYATIFGK